MFITIEVFVLLVGLIYGPVLFVYMLCRRQLEASNKQFIQMRDAHDTDLRAIEEYIMDAVEAVIYSHGGGNVQWVVDSKDSNYRQQIIFTDSTGNQQSVTSFLTSKDFALGYLYLDILTKVLSIVLTVKTT